jgi:hypothetical protein
MKNTDIAALIFIASLSVLAAYFIANAVIGSPSEQNVKVKTVEAISENVEKPDSTVFNKDAINPTVEVIIGGTNAGGQQTSP